MAGWLQTVAKATRPVRHPVNTAITLSWKLMRLPDQSGREIAYLKALFTSVGKGTLRVFEWGMGRSTVYYPSYLRAIGCDFEWHAIDHSMRWYEWVKHRVRTERLELQVSLYCAEIDCDPHRPCVSALVDPSRVARYVEHPKELPYRFDVMFVDGRFRRRCLLQAREVVALHGVVVLHDAQRPYYHDALAAYPFGTFVTGWRFPGSIPRSRMWIGSTGYDVKRWVDQTQEAEKGIA